jgi:2-keto-4-pentenoate hydratase/2-oxohepta-3-ene-1,7-dioic acid hydratase in catechol pathway
MGLSIVRFQKDNQTHWGVLNKNDIYVLKGSYESLADFLEHGIQEARTIHEQKNSNVFSFNEVKVLSPVTQPAQIICQGANYASHRAEAGLDAARPPFNTIFTKADSSLCEPNSDIVRPDHVKLLDYEIELGLIIGRDMTYPIQVTDENLHEYVAGLVLANDISARDIQLPQGQWTKGKSYRTFCPTGPILYLLDEEDVPSIHNLNLNLWVNNQLRQSANTNQLLFKPAETLTELSEIMDLRKGDMILTGTTGGVALNLSPEVMNELSNPFQSGEKKMRLLVESQLSSDKYLKDDDIIRAEITCADGCISLGTQINKVVRQELSVLKQ